MIPSFKIIGDDDNLEQIIKDNIEIAKIIRKELIKLRQESVDVESDCIISEISKKDSEVEVNDNESLDKEDEYYYYYSNLKEDYDKATTEEAQKDAVISNLPSVDNNNYMLIINRIKAEIHKEYLELESLKSDDESLSFIQEVEQEQQSLKELINIISTSQLEEVSLKESNLKKSNKLVFLGTSMGNVCAQNDILMIDEEYYDGFKIYYYR